MMEFYVMILLVLFCVLVFWGAHDIRTNARIRKTMKIGDVYYRLIDNNPFLEPQCIKIIDIKGGWCQYVNYDMETEKEHGSIHSCQQEDVFYHMKKYTGEIL